MNPPLLYNVGNNKGGFCMKFNDIKLEPLRTPNFQNIIRQQEESMRKLDESFRKRKEEETNYKNEVLETLKKIESNTVGLKEVVPLLASSIENQEEILDFLKEALSISTASSREEAESKWRQLMNKATAITKDVETIQKLQGFANVILQMFKDIN